jgi:hypothetical protein
MRLELNSFKTTHFPARSLDSFQPRGDRGATTHPATARLSGFSFLAWLPPCRVARAGTVQRRSSPFSYET